VAVLAKLGFEPLPETVVDVSKSKLNVTSEKLPALDPSYQTENFAGNFEQVDRTSKLTTVKPDSSSKGLGPETSTPQASSPESLASQTRGKHCFVQHEGEWHAGVLHAVIHETLVTVRNLTLDQYRGVHPSQVVFDEVDLPEGRKLAPSGLELLKKKAEEMGSDAKNPVPNDVVHEELNANGTKKMSAPIQAGLKVTLGLGTERTVAFKHRDVEEVKSEPEEEKKLKEYFEETKETNCAKIKVEKKDEKQWKEGDKCLARWDEDKVWYHATVLDTLQDQGDYLVFFSDYLNEAVVGKGEMVESIHEIPPGELVDENIEKALDLLPSHSVLPVKMEEGEGKHIPEVFLTRPKVGEQCVARWSDKVWYRASVDEVQEDGAIVLFTDHGNSDFVAWDLIELKASCIPPEATRDPNLPPQKSLTLTDRKLGSMRLRLEIGDPLSVALVESSGEVLVLTSSEVRRYTRQGVLSSCFCSDLDQPTEMLLLKSGQVVVREANRLKLFSADGQLLRSLGSQTDCSVGLAEDQNGLLVTINNNSKELEEVTEAGETDIFFIDIEKDTVLKRIEMKYLTEEDDDAVRDRMRLTHLHQHGEHLLVVDEGNHRVFLFHEEDGEDVVEILPTDGSESLLQFKALEVVADVYGNYLVLDRVNRCLQIVEAGWIKGFTLQLDMPLAKPSSLALDQARSELWLADFENNQIACYSLGQ